MSGSKFKIETSEGKKKMTAEEIEEHLTGANIYYNIGYYFRDHGELPSEERFVKLYGEENRELVRKMLEKFKIEREKLH